jgi:hypothetical protein
MKIAKRIDEVPPSQKEEYCSRKDMCEEIPHETNS